jgi:hypothetical protein
LYVAKLSAVDIFVLKRVGAINEPSWISMLLAPPYMVKSLAESFASGYRLDTVGLSAYASGMQTVSLMFAKFF